MSVGVGCGVGFGGRSAVPAPTITSVTPNYDSTVGGLLPHVITGTNLTGASVVAVGGTNVASYVVDSATKITFYAPAKAAGTHDLTVTTPGGTATLAGGFTTFLTAIRYRADYATLTPTNVSSWLDASGNGDANRNAVQAAGANQPLYLATDANFLNKPTHSYDAARHLVSGTFSSALSQSFTFYAVARHSTSGTRFLFDALTAAECAFYTPGDVLNLFAGSALASGISWLNQTLVVCGHFNGASSALYVNRYNTATASGAGGANQLTGITVGSSYALGNKWQGQIAELMGCPGVHNSATRQVVMNDLGARYGVTIIA